MELTTIEQEILNLKGLKNEDRENKIKEIAFNLYSFLKEKNYIIVEKDFLKSFFTELENTRTQASLFKQVLNFLITNDKLEITEKTKDRIRFKRNELISFDFCSYETLLKKGFCLSNGNKSIIKTNSPYKIKAYKVL